MAGWGSGLGAAGRSGRRFGAAAASVLLGCLLAGCHAGGAHVQQQNGYASSLQFGMLQMSESSSLSGGKSTYVDGVVRNMGNSTVSAVTVEVSFPTGEGQPAHVATLPLTLIRTRQPYVDVEPVSADPLLPGKTREFRLIFEGSGKDGVGPDWNQQEPTLRATRVSVLCASCP